MYIQINDLCLSEITSSTESDKPSRGVASRHRLTRMESISKRKAPPIEEEPQVTPATRTTLAQHRASPSPDDTDGTCFMDIASSSFSPLFSFFFKFYLKTGHKDLCLYRFASLTSPVCCRIHLKHRALITSLQHKQSFVNAFYCCRSV